MNRLFRLSFTALCGTLLSFTVGCNPPNESLPRLEPSSQRKVVLVEDRSIGYSSGLSLGSGVTLGSGMTYGSGMTASNGITFGSGITLGSGLTSGSVGFGSGTTASGIRPGSGTTYGSGIALGDLGSGTTGGGIRIGSGSTYGGGIRLGSGLTSGGGIAMRASSGVTGASPRVRTLQKSNPMIVIPEAGSGRSGALFDLLNARRREANKVLVDTVDSDGLKEKIAASKGTVIVVDVWSTSCIPCMREFPNLVSLSKEFEGKVTCISLNVDYIGLKSKSPQYYLPAVQKFLEKQRASKVTNLLSSEPDEDIRTELGVSSIPAILIYDSNGELKHNLGEHNSGGNGLSYEEDVIPLVKEML